MNIYGNIVGCLQVSNGYNGYWFELYGHQLTVPAFDWSLFNETIHSSKQQTCPLACLWGQDMVNVQCVPGLTYVVTLSLSCHMQYLSILDCIRISVAPPGTKNVVTWLLSIFSELEDCCWLSIQWSLIWIIRTTIHNSGIWLFSGAKRGSIKCKSIWS